MTLSFFPAGSRTWRSSYRRPLAPTSAKRYIRMFNITVLRLSCTWCPSTPPPSKSVSILHVESCLPMHTYMHAADESMVQTAKHETTCEGTLENYRGHEKLSMHACLVHHAVRTFFCPFFFSHVRIHISFDYLPSLFDDERWTNHKIPVMHLLLAVCWGWMDFERSVMTRLSPPEALFLSSCCLCPAAIHQEG